MKKTRKVSYVTSGGRRVNTTRSKAAKALRTMRKTQKLSHSEYFSGSPGYGAANNRKARAVRTRRSIGGATRKAIRSTLQRSRANKALTSRLSRRRKG